MLILFSLLPTYAKRRASQKGVLIHLEFNRVLYYFSFPCNLLQKKKKYMRSPYIATFYGIWSGSTLFSGSPCQSLSINVLTYSLHIKLLYRKVWYNIPMYVPYTKLDKVTSGLQISLASTITNSSSLSSWTSVLTQKLEADIHKHYGSNNKLTDEWEKQKLYTLVIQVCQGCNKISMNPFKDKKTTKKHTIKALCNILQISQTYLSCIYKHFKNLQDWIHILHHLIFFHLRGMDILSGGDNSVKVFFASLLKRGSLERERICSLGCKFFPFLVDPFSEGTWCPFGANSFLLE